jgi:hypothetical protein
MAPSQAAELAQSYGSIMETKTKLAGSKPARFDIRCCRKKIEILRWLYANYPKSSSDRARLIAALMGVQSRRNYFIDAYLHKGKIRFNAEGSSSSVDFNNSQRRFLLKNVLSIRLSYYEQDMFWMDEPSARLLQMCHAALKHDI